MPRNPRNQRYPAREDLPAADRGSVPARLWRARTELLLLAGLALLVLTLLGTAREGRWLPFVLLAGAVSAPAATRFGRNWITAHFWCVVSRHRLQRTCLETTMHTRAGRIPLVLWITPTTTGEKALVLVRAGVSAETFEAFGDEIAAACWARHVNVHRHRTRAQLLMVEIVRRDETPGATSPGLDRLYGRRAWIPLRSEFDEPPDLRAAVSLSPVG
ncbi:hypothetical protein FAF44_47320 [Nonomuraea sp. MG754425]|uniref:hypothetical protein n=1 Tax=Nonomuraea sp. MG754425 TaxID=2570319 RepID=UPI001F39CFF8|nr:hypothetical protein [Nonomuraea sp. MG754425]MCF6475900.1 hypothetical protein [Nonomuraea sp. MG754425]